MTATSRPTSSASSSDMSPVDESRGAERLAPSAWDRLDFMFSHPRTLQPVAGAIETVSVTGLSFMPDSDTVRLRPGGWGDPG